MRIVLVLDQYDNENNGTTVSAARFVEHLRANGHDVRVVSTGSPASGKYVIKTHIFPIIDPLISGQGMVFGRSDDAVVREAFSGADIVHLYLPFKLEMRAREIAEEMGIPYIAAFHCQPENVSYNIGMKYLEPLNAWIYRWFRKRFFQHVNHIHCPTQFIAEQLRKHKYKARLHIVSNGADEAFHPMEVEKPGEWKDKFAIMMVGRLSAEKRQDLIIKAALKSRYRDKIQLVFPGKGPKEKKYRKLGAKLKNPPIFGYYKKEELAKLINQCDLYVHASEAEIEAISCIEAFSCGLVPVIANAKMSATKQFALDKRCLFKNRSVKDLVKKIEYWIEHPEEKAEMSKRYIESAKKYRVSRSVEKMERIYQHIIDEKKYREAHANDPDAHMIHMPTTMCYKVGENFRFVNRNFFFKLGSTALYLFAILVLTVITKLIFGLKIEGQKNLRHLKSGAITVANHVHILDGPMVACMLFPRKAYMASLKTNFEIPFIRWLVRLLGGVPIPETPKALRAFMTSMSQELKKGRLVHFYPETALWPWYDKLRPFKNGAFHLAVESEVPVVPMVFKFREPRWLAKKIRKKPVVTLVVGKPVYPGGSGSQKERMEALRETTHEHMAEMIEVKAKA
ncbi:MAG: glycosyltransferase [Bacillota bacterium]|nr:glycosyltransferase [Bacillota bacterium]